jgi:hypothetical protein
MRRATIAVLVLAALALGACGNAVANPSPPPTVVAMNPPIGAVQAAVTLHMSRAANPKLTQSQVVVEKIEGDGARAKVLPEDPNAMDAAWVFLKKDAGLWTVVAGPGTAFTPEDMTSVGLSESLLP